MDTTANRAQSPRRRFSPAPALLFGWRSTPGFGWLEGSVLAAWMMLVAATIPRHEDWADEMQAWYLATDNSLWDIFRHRMHYEGAPALWHTVLHLFHAVGGTPVGMNWLGAALAGGGVFVFLRWSPFPVAIRVLLPFTYFFAYQYAVLARGYNMFALLCFSVCVLFPSRSRAGWIALLCGLLANLSLQGAIVGTVLLAFYLLDRTGESVKESGARTNVDFVWNDHGNFVWSASSFGSVNWRGLLRPLCIFVPLLGLAIVTAMPAPDVNFAVRDTVSDGAVHSLLKLYPGELPKSTPDPIPDWPLPPPAEALIPAPPFQPMHPAPWMGWFLTHPVPDPGSLAQAPAQFLVGAASQATWPLASSRILALVFLASAAWWMAKSRFLRGMLLWAIMIFVGQILWVADHHAGLLLITLIAVFWIARTRAAQRGIGFAPSGTDRLFLTLLTLVTALQLAWTFTSVRNDFAGKYAPGKDTAAYLHQVLERNPGASIAGFDSMAVTVQPYFAHNPFVNMRTRYWIWSETDNPNAHHRPTIAARPDVVVFTTEFPGPDLMRNSWVPMTWMVPPREERDLAHNPIVRNLYSAGYVETHRFCGYRFERMSWDFMNCQVIYEANPAVRPWSLDTPPLWWSGPEVR